MFFDEVIGQEEILQRLIHAIEQNRLAHALLFTGKRGVGKLSTALAIARYLHCTNRQGGKACGVCPSCKGHTRLEHPDLHFVFPIFKRDSAKEPVCDDFLPDWRIFLHEQCYGTLPQWCDQINAENKQVAIYTKEGDEIIRKLSLKSYQSEYKILILWHADRMTTECANKILKSLEEPYEKTLYLLISEEPDLLIETIRSRTQIIHFPTLPDAQISKALQERYTLSPEDAALVAHNAAGSFSSALEEIRLSEERTFFFEAFVQLMRTAYARDIKAMKTWSEEVAQIGREKQLRFFEYAQRMIRENFIFNLQQPSLNYLRREEANFSARFAPFVNHRNIYSIMEELGSAHRDIKQNGNAQIVLFDLSIRMILLLKQR